MTLVCLPGPLGFLWALRLLSLHPGPGHTNGSVAHVLYCAATAAADPVMPRPAVAFQGLCQFDVFPASAVARSVPVSGSSVRVPTPIVIAIPRDLHSSCARSMLGLCPLKSDRNAFSGRPASLAARLVPQPRCFSCACTSSASRRLEGPAVFLFIRVFTLVPHVAVFGCDTDPRIALVPCPSCAGVEPLGLPPKAPAPPSYRADRSMAVLRARRSGPGAGARFACPCSCGRFSLRRRAGFPYALGTG